MRIPGFAPESKLWCRVTKPINQVGIAATAESVLVTLKVVFGRKASRVATADRQSQPPTTMSLNGKQTFQPGATTPGSSHAPYTWLVYFPDHLHNYPQKGYVAVKRGSDHSTVYIIRTWRNTAVAKAVPVALVTPICKKMTLLGFVPIKPAKSSSLNTAASVVP